MQRRAIQPLVRPLRSLMRAPASKSETHRALVAAALADGDSVIQPALIADDTHATAEGLAALGARIERRATGWTVGGTGGRLAGGANIDARESGTTMRLLAAVAALGTASSVIDGAPRLRERPVQELANALERLGGAVEAGPSPGGLPLIVGGRTPTGDAVAVPGRRSSQFASALLLIAPRLPRGLRLELLPPAASLPYVDVTVDVMRRFGASVAREGELAWRVAPGGLRGCRFAVDGDWSSASYFLAAAALVGGRVRVDGLRADSPQPDRRVTDLLTAAGSLVRSGEDWIEVRGGDPLEAIDTDMSASPDLVPTVAVLAAFAPGRSILRNVAQLRLKESDRLEVVASNLRTLGREARALEDRLEIAPAASALHGGLIRTAGDHRIAMAFAVAGLRIGGIAVDDATCVTKSNPDFWVQLDGLAAPSAAG